MIIMSQSNNVINFQEHKDKLEKKSEEVRISEFIAQLSDEIDMVLDNLELICTDRNDYVLTLLGIRNYLADLVDSRLSPEEHEDE